MVCILSCLLASSLSSSLPLAILQLAFFLPGCTYLGIFEACVSILPYLSLLLLLSQL